MHESMNLNNKKGIINKKNIVNTLILMPVLLCFIAQIFKNLLLFNNKTKWTEIRSSKPDFYQLPRLSLCPSIMYNPIKLLQFHGSSLFINSTTRLEEDITANLSTSKILKIAGWEIGEVISLFKYGKYQQNFSFDISQADFWIKEYFMGQICFTLSPPPSLNFKDVLFIKTRKSLGSSVCPILELYSTPSIYSLPCWLIEEECNMSCPLAEYVNSLPIFLLVHKSSTENVVMKTYFFPYLYRWMSNFTLTQYVVKHLNGNRKQIKSLGYKKIS